MERRAQADALLLNATLLAGCTGSQGGAKHNQSEAKTHASPAAEAIQPAAASKPGPSHSSAIKPSEKQNAAGRLALKVRDSEVVISAPSCDPTRQDPAVCSGDVGVSLKRNGGPKQGLRADALHIYSDATLFRGPRGPRGSRGLRGPRDQRDSTKSQAVVIADVNGDDREDVSLGTGTSGGYGSPSYDVHLHDVEKNGFVRSQPLSALTLARLGWFQLDVGRLRMNAKSGCCIQSTEQYAVERSVPVLIEHIEEDASGGKDLLRKTVWRGIDGAMQELENLP